MANVVRDPRESPNVIIPDLSTNKSPSSRRIRSLSSTQPLEAALLHQIGDDYYPEPAQWDVINKVWRPYFVPNGADWWCRSILPTICSGPPAHLRRLPPVGYDIHTKKVAEWNVGCERCHGPAASTWRIQRAAIS